MLSTPGWLHDFRIGTWVHGFRLGSRRVGFYTLTGLEGSVCFVVGYNFPIEARKLEHDPFPTTKHRKKIHQHKSPYIHIPFFGVYCRASVWTAL